MTVQGLGDQELGNQGLGGLQAEGLAGGYVPGQEIVRGVALGAQHGTLTCIIGPNGAGKSTALKLLAGLLHRSAGRIVLDGRALTDLGPQHVAAAGVVCVPQERNIFAALSVEENLRMGAYRLRGGMAARLDDAYARFPQLRDRRRAAAGSLSGGQRQVLAMAAALMSAPRALLLDEPTAGVAPLPAAGLLDTIRALARSGLAILMVEQNAMEALAVSDRAVVMVDGRVARAGPADAVAADPDIRRLFLGGRDPQTEGPAA